MNRSTLYHFAMSLLLLAVTPVSAQSIHQLTTPASLPGTGEVIRVSGVTSDGMVYFSALTTDPYRATGLVYDPTDERLFTLEEGGRVVGTYGGELVVEKGIGMHLMGIFVLRDRAFSPLKDSTGQQLNYYPALSNTVIFASQIYTKAYGLSVLHRVDVHGTTYTEDSLAGDFAIGSLIVHRSPNTTLFTGTTTDQDTRGLVTDHDGHHLYTFDIPDRRYPISADEAGYFSAVGTMGEPTDELEYRFAGTDSTIRLRLPDSLDIIPNASTFQLGRRIVVSEPGSSPFTYHCTVVDADTGEGRLLDELGGAELDSLTSVPLQIGNLLYFAARERSGEVTLWRSDGTGAGTYRISSVDPRPAFDDHRNLLLTDSVFYFSGVGPAGHEVFALQLDGSEKVSLYADIQSGPSGSEPQDFVSGNGGIYLRARPDGEELQQLFFLGELSTGVRSVPEPTDLLVVYPNPATEAITILLPAGETSRSLALIEAGGRLVGQWDGAEGVENVTLDGLPPGMYHLVVRYASGRRGYAGVQVVRRP